MTSWSLMSSLQAIIVWICVICLTLMNLAKSISLAPVYWNTSNSIFKSSRNDHVIEVQLYDDIDVICPFYPASLASDDLVTSQFEHYVIYRVKKSDYDNCIVDIDDGAQMVLNCSEPRQRRRFTILFEPYQSIPNVPEYHPGRSYYFITTSSGDLHGLSDLHQGACAKRNMRLAVHVCCHIPAVISPVDKVTEIEELNSVDSKSKLSLGWSSAKTATTKSITSQPGMTSSTTSSPRHVIASSRSIGRRNKLSTVPTARVKPLAKFAAGNSSSSMSSGLDRDNNTISDDMMHGLLHSMMLVSSGSEGGAHSTMTSLVSLSTLWLCLSRP